MNELIDERRYAWRMIRAARQAQSTEIQVSGTPVAREDIAELLELALDAGMDRAEIILELADLAARFFALCSPSSLGATSVAGALVETSDLDSDLSSSKAVSV